MNLGQFGHRPAVSRRATFEPGGYLSFVQGAVMSDVDQTVSTLFYTQDIHNGLPLIRGGQFEYTPFAEEPISLAGLAASSVFDLYAFDHRGAGKFGWSPAWQSAAPGAGVRGTGPGSIQQVRQDGLLVNRYPIQLVNNGASRILGERQGTWLASVCIGSTPAQATLHRSYGQSRRCDVSNGFNKKQIILKAGDNTASWGWGSASVRASNGTPANSLTVFCAQADEIIRVDAVQRADVNSGASTAETNCGVGWNSTIAFSGKVGSLKASASSGPLAVAASGDMVGCFIAPPSLGPNVATMLEASPSVISNTYFGTEAKMLLAAVWRA